MVSFPLNNLISAAVFASFCDHGCIARRETVDFVLEVSFTNYGWSNGTMMIENEQVVWKRSALDCRVKFVKITS